MFFKRLLPIIVLCSTTLSYGEMHFDRRTRVFFSYPGLNQIDPAEYNSYANDFFIDLIDYLKMDCSDADYAVRMARMNAIKKFTPVNSATSQQFVSDVKHVLTIECTMRIFGMPISSEI